MMVARCPRDGTLLREVETRSLFTKHAGCSTCHTLYVIWGDSMTRCLTPRGCAGETWKYLSDKPVTLNIPAPKPKVRANR